MTPAWLATGLQQPPLAFVTGANKGIGNAIAGQLGRAGWRVILGCRSAELGEAAAAATAVVAATVAASSGEARAGLGAVGGEATLSARCAGACSSSAWKRRAASS